MSSSLYCPGFTDQLSRIYCRKSSRLKWRREKPITENLRGSIFLTYRESNAGISLRWDKSPVTPKMMKIVGYILPSISEILAPLDPFRIPRARNKNARQNENCRDDPETEMNYFFGMFHEILKMGTYGTLKRKKCQVSPPFPRSPKVIKYLFT